MPSFKFGKTFLDTLTPEKVFEMRLEEAQAKGKSPEEIEAIRAAGVRPQEDVTDIAKKGLSIRVSRQKGVINKVWRFSVASKKMKMGKHWVVGFGTYPATGLAAAHARVDQMRGNVEAGREPEQDTDETEGDKKTVKDLVDTYVAWLKANKKKSWQAIEQLLYKDLIADPDRPGVVLYGHLPTMKFTIEKRAEMITTINKREAPTVTNRVCAYLKAMIRKGVDLGFQFDPRMFVVRAMQNEEHHRTRYLSNVEFPKVWNRLPVAMAAGDTPHMDVLLRLAAIFGCRINQVCGMRQSEIVRNDWLGCNVWIIPKDRAKNKHEHELPIPALAEKLLAPVLEQIGKRDVIFKSCQSDEPVSGRVVGAALKRYLDEIGVKDWTPHTLRHTLSTQLVSEENELGVDRFIRSNIIHHRSVTHAGVTGVYDHNKHLKQTRVALEKWCALIEKWSGNGGDNVVPFASKAA